MHKSSIDIWDLVTDVANGLGGLMGQRGQKLVENGVNSWRENAGFSHHKITRAMGFKKCRFM